MNVPKNLSVVIVGHLHSCFMKDKDNKWSGITDGYYWGNFKAKKTSRGANHIWHRVICNDPSCPAIKAIHSSVLENA